MFKHILVPIDLSDKNQRPLDIAAMLAEKSGARVSLLHEIQRVAGLSARELGAFYHRLVRTSEQKLARAGRRFASRRVRVETSVIIGDPPREIVRASLRRRADLIVMGSHRINPSRPATGLGTTSYKVGLACRCPVLLVK